MDNENKLFAKTLKYFELVISDDDKNPQYKCLIEKCDKKLCGKYPSNIIKHARRMHPEFFALKIQGKTNQLSMPQKRLKFIQDSVEVVTINGRSFMHLDDSGHKKLIEEKMIELVENGYGEGLSGPHFTAIKEQIAYLAKEVKMKIKEEVKDRYVSIMIDFATKHRRNIMGVSLQYVKNGRTEVRSIGMLKMNSSCTGENTLNVLLDLLDSFGIEKSHVVSVTTDNAANLTLMVKMLNETVERESEENNQMETEDNAGSTDPENENSGSCDSNSQFHFDDIESEIREAIESTQPDDSDSDEELDELLNDEDVYVILIEALANKFASSTLTVNGVNCAAHTLQLAVMAALKDKRLNINNLIKLCRLVCKTLRKMSYQYILQENGISFKIPRLDCRTRWSSTYYMVRISQKLCINSKS